MTVLLAVVFLGTLAYRIAVLDQRRRVAADVLRHQRAVERDRYAAALERELAMKQESNEA